MGCPELKRLLEDIKANKINIIVVYKVDITRSLTDFAKIVERVDAKEAYFVSVTQQFNTPLRWAASRCTPCVPRTIRAGGHR